MSEFVGVRSCFEYGNIPIKNWFSPQYSLSLKNQALLFDKIGIVNLEAYLIPVKIFEPANPHLLDLDFLQQNGIVFDYNTQRTWSDAEKLLRFHLFLQKQGMGDYPIKVNNAQIEKINATTEFAKKAQAITQKRLDELLQLNPNNPADTYLIEKTVTASVQATDELLDELRRRMLENDSGDVRLVAMWMEQFEDSEVIPLLSCKEYLQEIPGSKKTDAVEVVINELPVSDEETAWERILEYRRGPYFEDDRYNLRRWIRKISSENHPPLEIRDELKYLMNVYAKHLKMHDIKLRFGQFRTLIKLPFDIVGDLVRFDFARLLDPLFDIYERKIALWEAELNAPGNEVAYIIKTRDAFR